MKLFVHIVQTVCQFRRDSGSPFRSSVRELLDVTDAVFSRYNIVSEADLRDAARKIEEGAKAAVSDVTDSYLVVEAEKEAKQETKPF